MNEYRILPQPPEYGRLEGPQQPMDDAIDLDGASTIIWHHLRILKRHAWKIAGFVAAVVAATLLYSARLQPLYRASVQLELESGAPINPLANSGGGYYYRDDERFMRTQIRLIYSPEVAETVVRDLGLTRSPLFGYKGDGQEVIPSSLGGLSVEAVPETYLLSISYVHTNPELCRDIANAVAKAYIEQGYAARIQSAQDVNNVLRIQLEQLKAESETAEQALLDFQMSHGISPADDRSQLVDQQVTALQVSLIDLETTRMQAEAEYASVNSGGIEDILSSSRSQPVVDQLSRRKALEDQMQTLSATYGPNHPTRRALQLQIDQTDSAMESARQRVLASLEADLRAVKTREESVREAYLEKKEQADRLSVYAIEYGSLKRQVEAKTALYEDLLMTVNRVGLQSSVVNPNGLKVAAWATTPWAPFYPNVPQYLIWAFLAATMVGVAGAILSDYLDRTVRDSEQVEQWLRVPVLANLPRLSGTQRPQSYLLPAAGDGAVAKLGDRSHEAHALVEGFTMLRTSLLLSSQANNVRLILVASAVPAEGKSTVAAGLAAAIAQQTADGKRVLLLDADLRRPTVHSTFGLNNQSGLSSLLEGRCDIDSAIQPAPGLKGLWLLPRGPATAQPNELLSAQMGRVLEDLRARFEYVVVDSAPILASADSIILSTLVDGVVIVARAGGTSREMIGAALRQVKRVRGNVLGLILNQVTQSDHDSYHYYYGYYGREEEVGG